MTARTPAPVGRGHLMAGSVIGAASLVLGPALGSIGTVLRHEVWNSTYPDYPLVDKYHYQNVLATQLVTLAFPILIISVFATAWVARGSRKLTGTATLTSVFGLAALFGKAVQNSTVVAMAGIHDQNTLDRLAKNISDQSPAVLWAFPLYILGSLLLGVALWRSRSVPRWSAALVGLGALAPISVLTGTAALGPVIAALRITGSIPLIKILLTRTTDDHAATRSGSTSVHRPPADATAGSIASAPVPSKTGDPITPRADRARGNQ